ncbi:MAG: aspartyl/asparaginyl beta-hydroxylase domain-containing protein [Chitinophagales bacterium]|nr:aspartyl/asparaginyl beta-hydroxylase domain-containing protein [Chitinophagales bacterium]
MNESEYEFPKGEEIVYLRPPKEEYKGKMKPFYNPANFPELQPLLDNWEKIRDEVLSYEKKNGFLNITNTLSPGKVTGKGKWNLTYLMSFSRIYHSNIELFPFTWSVLQQIPNIVFAGVSILPPHTTINPHYGDTNGIVRGHLGLIIPSNDTNELGINVSEEINGWKEGEIFCFMNVIKHWVWNKTSERRYVIMFDFIPQPLVHKQKEICARGLGSQSFIYMYKHWSWVKSLPEFLYEPMCRLFALIWRVYLPFQRRLKFLP